MLRIPKFVPIVTAVALIALGAGQAKAQWDRSYLQLYPQCDLSGSINPYDYLNYYGDAEIAQRAMLEDLYNLEMQCVSKLEQQYWNQRVIEAPIEQEYYEQQYWDGKVDSFQYGD
jgi:hypothetical protein